MKTPFDPRHQKRISRMEQLFSYSFRGDGDYGVIRDIIPHISVLDEHIQSAAPEWPLPKIARIDLAILRLSAYELLTEKHEPPKVIIDEAVELAKSYGNPNSSKFVNGVLGTLLKNL